MNPPTIESEYNELKRYYDDVLNQTDSISYKRDYFKGHALF